jgi:hypothetical protein
VLVVVVDGVGVVVRLVARGAVLVDEAVCDFVLLHPTSTAKQHTETQPRLRPIFHRLL